MKPLISIVHIDDNPGDLTLAHEAFSSHGEVAYEGIEQPISGLAHVASETIAGRPPSLILLDLNLPGFHGTEVLRLLHANAHLEKIPVVIFTSSTMEQERDDCLRLGATAVMTKPATFEELCELTTTIMGMIPQAIARDLVGSSCVSMAAGA